MYKLDNVKEANGGNLFHKVIASGKKELITEALKQAAEKPSLVESTNKDGNNLAHLHAVSQDLRTVAKEANVVLTPKSIGASNHAGKTGVDVAMHGYKSDKADTIEKSESAITLENTVALGVAGYVASGVVISAGVTLATATTPLLIGVATLQT